jgi:hypothetical protein
MRCWRLGWPEPPPGLFATEGYSRLRMRPRRSRSCARGRADRLAQAAGLQLGRDPDDAGAARVYLMADLLIKAGRGLVADRASTIQRETGRITPGRDVRGVRC